MSKTYVGNTGNVNTGWTSLGASTTEAHEAAEWEYWRAKVAAAGSTLARRWRCDRWRSLT